VAEEEVSEEVEGELPETPAAEAAPEAPQAEADVWDSFRQLPDFKDKADSDIAAQLYETMQREQYASRALQQYQAIVPAASEYLSNRELFEQWKNSQNQPQAPAPQPMQRAPEQDAWWNPPKVRDSYKQYIVRDEQGREVISENAPLEARHALAEYQSYKADFARKFLEDPQQALGPMIEKIVGERAREIAESQITGLKEESFVARVESENKDWLYDASGNVSREGLLVQKYIEDARGYGIRGAEARWQYATKMVERDLALANLQAMQQPQMPPQQYQQPVPQAPPQQAVQAEAAQRNMEFLRQQATRTAPRRAQTNTTAESRNPQKPMTFAERMLRNLQQSGLD
jgi:hypothetical protein